MLLKKEPAYRKAEKDGKAIVCMDGEGRKGRFSTNPGIYPEKL